MWATLALAAALQTTPAQTGAFALKNLRPSYSVLGQTRKEAKYLGGELVILNYDLQNLKVPEDGVVQYSLAIEITSKSGKSIFKPEAQEFKGQLTLGGNVKTALSVYEVPLNTTDMAPGEYVFIITGTDLMAKTTDKIEYAFEVLPPRLGIIQPGIHIPVSEKTLIPSPWSIPVGQTVVLGFAVVGFELGPKSQTDLKKRQPDLRVEMRVVDDSTGKDTLPKPKYDGITEVREEYKRVIPFTPLLEMNRPGRFKIQLKVTDNYSKQTAELSLDVTVFEVK